MGSKIIYTEDYMTKLFTLNDEDGNKCLDFQEFVILCLSEPPYGLGMKIPPKKRHDLFNQIDIDKNGVISMKELLVYFTKANDKSYIPAKKRIALVAHDKHKGDLVNWCKKWKNILCDATLIGTGTTARKVQQEVDLKVEILQSGPYGGDQQIGARIAERRCDFLVFFWDPVASMAHDQDVKALFRIASLYNIMIATNSTTADLIISNPIFSNKIEVKFPNMESYLKRDVEGDAERHVERDVKSDAEHYNVV